MKTAVLILATLATLAAFAFANAGAGSVDSTAGKINERAAMLRAL